MKKFLSIIALALTALLVLSAPAHAATGYVPPASAKTSGISSVTVGGVETDVLATSGQYLLHPKVNGQTRNLRIGYLAFESASDAHEFAADLRSDLKGTGFRIVVGSTYVVVLGQFLAGGPDSLNNSEVAYWNTYAVRIAKAFRVSAPVL